MAGRNVKGCELFRMPKDSPPDPPKCIPRRIKVKLHRNTGWYRHAHTGTIYNTKKKTEMTLETDN